MSILKLAPACKDYLWGGTKLITDYGKRYDGARLAETWELSGHPDGPSVLTSGPDAGKTLAEYLAAHPGALGEHGRKFAELPVLIKLIDAAKDLSIQVHPDDAYARAHEGQNGKTEMWYVLSAEPDAFLYCGFSRDISRDELKRRIADNTLPEVLRRVNVKAGDTVFIPAGTIHAICRGIVVAEVQQSSNVTYRVCDYGRLGPDGKPRALHIAQALDVTRRTAGVPTPVPPPAGGSSPWFAPAAPGHRTPLPGPATPPAETLPAAGPDRGTWEKRGAYPPIVPTRAVLQIPPGLRSLTEHPPPHPLPDRHRGGLRRSSPGRVDLWPAGPSLPGQPVPTDPIPPPGTGHGRRRLPS